MQNTRAIDFENICFLPVDFLYLCGYAPFLVSIPSQECQITRHGRHGHDGFCIVIQMQVVAEETNEIPEFGTAFRIALTQFFQVRVKQFQNYVQILQWIV